VKVSRATGNFNGQCRVIAVKPTLVIGKMHLLYWYTDNKVMYMQYDFTRTIHQSIEIGREFTKFSYGIFGKDDRSFVEPKLSNTIYEAFVGASMKSFTQSDGNAKDIVRVHGAVLTT